MKNKQACLAGRQAVVLLSGGLDSAVALYQAKKQGFECRCLIFDYKQRHRRELKSAQAIARYAGCKAELLKISLPWKGSALLDKRIKLKKSHEKIPATYVPGRNIIFLSCALSFAETIGAQAIFIGAHIEDYSGYPDCRPEFFRAFSRVAAIGTKVGNRIRIINPVLRKNKAQIINLGKKLGVPLRLTWSCYKGGERPCGKCDSCFYRAKGFKEAGMEDPALK
ncbi:MAG: 7-cyano-7-deazaguanine synthase QueC [Candidatus Omnitrophica bacterium]|nr:7-cyano-7-deazaguanine synthase QueC [Candidatus Omnitrophota bacterium]MDD5653894.1 7-cyano-7-deazaguanine synthase QueC [Candidatus Omnitrophota bacterium]